MGALDELVQSTFATQEAAEAALARTDGDVPKARKDLASRKRTPVDPAVGPRVVALVAAARARGSLPSRNGGVLSWMAPQALPRDLAALVFAGIHWHLEGVDLGGARLSAPAMSTFDPRFRADHTSSYPIGELASGAALVAQVSVSGPVARFVAFTDDGERVFDDLDDLLGHIVADAHDRGLTTALDAPPAKPAKPQPGPPPAEPGEDLRVYAGALPLEVSISHVDLYATMQITFRPTVKSKLPPNDLWLVSREGRLYRLALLGPMRRGVVTCQVQPVSSGSGSP